MAYMKFKELTKYFDFKIEITEVKDLPDYTREYVEDNEEILMGYKNSKDYVVFTNRKMLLFDRDVLGVHYKKVHVVPYKSISTSAINYLVGKVEMLFR